MDGCRYRLFVAGNGEAIAPAPARLDGVTEALVLDAFASWVSPHIALLGDPARRGRRRRVGEQL
jgi:hypothetical protein